MESESASTTRPLRPVDAEEQDEREPGGDGAGSASRLRDELAHLDREARALCRDHPLAVLGAAVALGFVVGRIATRY